jgi:hypothetical protein
MESLIKISEEEPSLDSLLKFQCKRSLPSASQLQPCASHLAKTDEGEKGKNVKKKK